ncbi:hypothetical protein BDW66DRAFT_44764 [Aspergillus desertorum]
MESIVAFFLSFLPSQRPIHPSSMLMDKILLRFSYILYLSSFCKILVDYFPKLRMYARSWYIPT